MMLNSRTRSQRKHRTLLILSMLLAACGLSTLAQTQTREAAPQLHADMNQLMRGVLYPAANVVFSAQADNPGDVKIVNDPSMSTDPLTSTFGGWQAVENAALALAESANLVSLPGRKCSNGVLAPTKDPTWVAFVQDVRDASMKSYTAAVAKDQDKMIETAEKLSDSCAGCHRKFRDRRPAANRCK
jgi:hypothetical protein